MIAPVTLDIIGIFQLASGKQFTGIPSWVWFQFAFIFLQIIPFIAFHKLRVKYDEKQDVIDKLINARPSITVELIKERDTRLLKVKNVGEEAILKAQIELDSGDPSVLQLSNKSYYRACWDNPEKHQATIPKGHSANIKIAELYSSPPGFNILTWYLFYCDNSNGENYALTSSHWVGAYYVNEDGNRSQKPYKPCYEYKLHIIISASPSLREGTFEGDYVVSYERGVERLVSDKEDSPT